MKEIRIHINDQGEITNRKGLANLFKSLEPGDWDLQFRPYKQRSLRQNGYFHGVILPLVLEGLRDAGFNDVRTNADAKLILKSLFLKRDILNPETAELLTTVTRDTSQLSTAEFNEFIESIIKWGVEYLGIQIPYPNEQLQMDFAWKQVDQQ